MLLLLSDLYQSVHYRADIFASCLSSTEIMSSTTTTSAAPTSSAAPQGGILEGLNPIHYSPTDPIKLFIIQAILIIITCRILHYPLSKIGQPRVIAEVIGGIVLGPSVMMRIPGFQENIFPKESMPVLSNVANLGLLLFLFLVGLEVDTRLFRQNAKVALYVGMAGMLLPFGLGYAIAWGLYHEFRVDSGLQDISFGIYGLFVGTALSITAFPVLCRILSELQLISSPVGVTVLAAGIGNDVVGWVLLALSVALVNNGSGLSALYVFLTAVAWVLFLVYAIRPAFLWVLRRTGSIQQGPSPGIIALTLIIVLISAWFTAAIGVHAIFGAFLVGLICPHDGGFAIKLTEKIEDLVSVLFLPLFFALSGLSTNLGLLDDGKTWGYVIAVISIAFFGKIVGGMLAAKLCKLLWRESIAIGVLMSCKGLVELIVLNIGLQAGILSQRTFTVFVVMALVTTVATTPLAKWAYPMSYRKKVEQWKRGEIDWDGTPIISEAQIKGEQMAKAMDKARTSRVLVQLRLDSLSSLFGLISMLGEAKKTFDDESTSGSESVDFGGKSAAASVHKEDEDVPAITTRPVAKVRRDPLEVRGMRLVELTDRTSSVMQSAELDEFSDQDFVFSAFRTFSQLNGLAVAGHVSAVPTNLYANTLIEEAKDTKADLMIVPWSVHGTLAEDTSVVIPNEFASLSERFANRQHIEFVQEVVARSSCNTGIFISRSAEASRSSRPNQAYRTKSGVSVQSGRDVGSQLVLPIEHVLQVFFPFIGGADDHAAMLFALQLAHNPNVHVTVARIVLGTDDPMLTSEKDLAKVTYPESSHNDEELFSSAQVSLASTPLEARVDFVEVEVAAVGEVTDSVVRLAREKVRGKTAGGVDDLVVVGNRHSRLEKSASGDLGTEHDFQKTVGVLGSKLAHAGLEAGVLVIRAGSPGSV